MRVKATKLGYYGIKRVYPGDVFDMDEDTYQPKNPDGKPLLDSRGKPKTCQWVVPVGSDSKAKVKAKGKAKAKPEPEPEPEFEDEVLEDEENSEDESSSDEEVI